MTISGAAVSHIASSVYPGGLMIELEDLCNS